MGIVPGSSDWRHPAVLAACALAGTAPASVNFLGDWGRDWTRRNQRAVCARIGRRITTLASCDVRNATHALLGVNGPQGQTLSSRRIAPRQFSQATGPLLSSHRTERSPAGWGPAGD